MKHYQTGRSANCLHTSELGQVDGRLSKYVRRGCSAAPALIKGLLVCEVQEVLWVQVCEAHVFQVFLR